MHLVVLSPFLELEHVEILKLFGITKIYHLVGKFLILNSKQSFTVWLINIYDAYKQVHGYEYEIFSTHAKVTTESIHRWVSIYIKGMGDPKFEIKETGVST
jgi:hypothetical protein